MPMRHRIAHPTPPGTPAFFGLLGAVLASLAAAVPESVDQVASLSRSSTIAQSSWWTPAAELAVVYAWDDRGAAEDAAGLSRASSALVLSDDAETLALLGHRGVLSPSNDASLFAFTGPSIGLAHIQNAGTESTVSSVTSASRDANTASNSWFAILRLALSSTFLLKCGCIGSNFLFQVSPLPIVKRFRHAGSTGDSDSAPFISQMFCCSQFSFYGLIAYIVTRKTGFLVLVYSNLVGICMGFYYVAVFLRHCKNPDIIRLTSKYLTAVGIAVSFQVACLLLLPTERALLFIGLVSSTCSLISAFSLVTAVPEVIRTRCSRGLHKPLLMAAEVNGLLWVTTGLTLWDFYIFVPNVVCVALNTFALGMAWYFPEHEPAECNRKGSDIASHTSYGAAGTQGETGGTPSISTREV